MFLSKNPKSDQNGAPSVIIVCDTKALIIQVEKILRTFLEETESLKDREIDFLFGGKYLQKEKFDVLITTFEQLKNNILKKKVLVQNVKFVIIDEADNVLRTEFS